MSDLDFDGINSLYIQPPAKRFHFSLLINLSTNPYYVQTFDALLRTHRPDVMECLSHCWIFYVTSRAYFWHKVKVLLANERPESHKENIDEIQYAKMRVIASPNVRISDIFKSLLFSVPNCNETLQALLQYGDSISATSVKFLLNERNYEASTLINEEYTQYQGPALCACFDKVLTTKQWEEIFLFKEGIDKFQSENANKFLSFFHISDFITVVSGRKAAFIDPSERLSLDERSFVAIFDLDSDAKEIRLLADQFRPVFDAPLLSASSSGNGTIIRLPLRRNSHSCNVSDGIFSPNDVLSRLWEFSRLSADLILLLLHNVCSISFYRSVDGRIYQQLFSWELADVKKERSVIHDLCDGAIANLDLPSSHLTILQVNIEQESVSRQSEWLLSVFADTIGLLSNNPLVLKIAIPISERSFHHDESLCALRKIVSTDTAVVRCFYISRLVVCYLEEGTDELFNEFSKLPLSDALKRVHFEIAFGRLLRDLTRRPRYQSNPELIWSLMPDVKAHFECSELIPDIWEEIGRQEIFFSLTDGWGYVAVEDMIINNLAPGPLQKVVTFVFTESNAPVVQLPPHVIAGLSECGKKQHLQVVTPYLVSEVLKKNLSVLMKIPNSEKVLLLDYILKYNDPNLILDLPLLPLANNEFAVFANKSKTNPVFVISQQFLSLFSQSKERILSTSLPTTMIDVLSSSKFQDSTQVQKMSTSDFADMVMLPREWRRGEDVITWSKHHEYHNLLWLENLWKYIREKMPADLTMIENYNLLYVNNPRERFITLYKLSKNPVILHCSKEHLLDPLMIQIQRILQKLGINVIDNFPEIITSHPAFEQYAPMFNATGVVIVLSNKLRHMSQTKVVQEFNSILTDKEIISLRTFLSRIPSVEMNDTIQQELKHLPIFDNAFPDTPDKFIATNGVAFVYESGPKLPLLLPKLIIFVSDADSRMLLEKMGYRIVEFTTIAKQVIIYTSQVETHHIPTTVGKWLLLNCGGLILTDGWCQETLSALKLFMNRKQELCSPSQLIDPSFREKFISVLSPHLLPSNDICSDRMIGLLKVLHLRTIYDLKCDELVELCENSRSFSVEWRKTFAELLIEVISFNQKLFHEFLPSPRSCTFKSFIHSFAWVSIALHRPVGYPLSLQWFSDNRKITFASPYEVVDKSFAFVAGSIAFVSDLEVPLDHRSKLSFREVNIELLTRHLKAIVNSFVSADRSEFFDYMNITKKCYEVIHKQDINEFLNELRSADVESWVWNGNGFSSPSTIFLLEKSHILSSYFVIVPYEMYGFTKFFEKAGVKHRPNVQLIEDLLTERVRNIYNSGTLTDSDRRLMLWIKESYKDTRIQSLITEVITTHTVDVAPNQILQKCHNEITISIPPDFDKPGIKDVIRTAVCTIIKEKEVSVLVSSMKTNAVLDHYRLYNELLLPNLNVFSRNVKDAIVLLALDNCDARMMFILREHCCIPVTPNGHTLRRPSRLVHPSSKLAGMYSDVEGFFPYGSSDTYLREDRLSVLRLLGMKYDKVSWQELSERAELVSKIRDEEVGLERAIGIITVLSDMVQSSDLNESVIVALKFLSTCAFIPVKPRPSKFPLIWAGDRFKHKLVKPIEVASSRYQNLLSCSVPVAYDSYGPSENIISAKLETLLNFHAPCVNDVLFQLSELSALPQPIYEDALVSVFPIAYSCYEWLHRACVKAPDKHLLKVKEFFIKTNALLVGNRFYNSNQIFLNLNQSIPPYFVSAYTPQIPLNFLKEVLNTAKQPSVDMLVSVMRSFPLRVRETQPLNRDDLLLVLKVLTLLADREITSLPSDLPLPNSDGVLKPPASFGSSGMETLHPAVDFRLQSIIGVKRHEEKPRMLSITDRKLESILLRIDSPLVDKRLRESLDDRNPALVLEFLLEANRAKSIVLSSDDVSYLMNYFDSFLQNGTETADNFQKLRELPLFRTIWAGNSHSLELFDHVYLVSESFSQILLKTFNRCPFERCGVLSLPSRTSRIWSHLRVIILNEADAFLQLCVPFMPQLSVRLQKVVLLYLRDNIWDNLTTHEQSRLSEVLASRLHIATRHENESKLCSLLYDPTALDVLPLIDPIHELPHSDLKTVLNLLPLRTVLDEDKLKALMESIERKVKSASIWTDKLRQQSRSLYEHISLHYTNISHELFNIPFLEPQKFESELSFVFKCFGSEEIDHTVLSLNDGVLYEYQRLVWTSSFVLPEFVGKNLSAASKLALGLPSTPSHRAVLRHILNISEALSEAKIFPVQLLVSILSECYEFFSNICGDAKRDVINDLSEKPIIWSSTTRSFVSANRVCVSLKNDDEIPPFLYSVPPEYSKFHRFFIDIGAMAETSPVVYADLLGKMARVCRNDYLNSNEICKCLKAMAGFFTSLKQQPLPLNARLTGVFFLTGELKMKRSSEIVIMDQRSKVDYINRLNDNFLFNPSERVISLEPHQNNIKECIDKIFVSQRPTLFSEKYEESFSMAIPENKDSNRQRVLHALERKYSQLLNSRTLHRCLSRALADGMAREKSQRIVSVDDMELLLRSRLSLIKSVCVEHLETALIYRSTQQRIDHTVEEQAVYLISESSEELTLYISVRHAEMPYFPFCLSKALLPLLSDLQLDSAILSALLSSSIGHMSRVLDLTGVSAEENILATLKLHYVPSPGRLYGDDVSLLSLYDPKQHVVVPGDLCIYCRMDSVYVYCAVVCQLSNDRIVIQIEDEEIEIPTSNFYVLENWSRVYDAADARPLDDRECPQQPLPDDENLSESSSTDLNDEERAELDLAKMTLDTELREAYFQHSGGNDRKRRVKKLLLKWHPDKNPGREKFASEVFKHLRKQIELLDIEPSLGSVFSWAKSSFADDLTSCFSSRKFGGSYDNLHTASQGQSSPPESSASADDTPKYTNSSTNIGSTSPPGRSSSFRTAREEWQWRRQQGFSRRTGFFTEESNQSSAPPSGQDDRRKQWNGQQTEAQRWLKQAYCDLQAANNDMNPTPPGVPSYEWVCYKCYRATEKALKSYHHTKSPGKLLTSDIPTLLFGIDSEVRAIGYKLYKWLGDPNRMQYPNAARFSKIPNEVFTATQAEQSLEYTKELLKKVEEIFSKTEI